MKSFEGYLKRKLGDSYILLAGGGEKSLSDFLTRISPNPTSESVFNTAQQHGNMKLIDFVNGNSYYSGSTGVPLDNRSVILHFSGHSSSHWTQLYLNSGSLRFRSEDNTSWYTVYHTGNLPAYPTKASWNYDDRYVTFVGVTDDTTSHANQLRYVLDGNSNYFTVPYATTTESSNYLNNNSGTPETAYQDLKVKWFPMSLDSWEEGKQYVGTNAGFPGINNANGILWFGTHPGNYGGQLGISSNGKIYYRYISNGSFPATANGGSWKKIAFISDIPTIPSTYAWTSITGKPISGDTGNNGPTWGNFVPVKSDGVMEIGKYLDFHNSSNDGVDYAVRLMCQGNNQIVVNLPTSSGTLALTSQIPNTYSWSSITSAPDTATRWPTWDEITGKPDNFTPSAHTHAYLSGGYNIPTHQQGDSTLHYQYHVAASTTGTPATTDNSNGILTVNRHEGDYYSQLGFGSDGRLKYRSYSAQAINADAGKAWNVVAWKSELPTKASWNYDDVYSKLGHKHSYTDLTGSGAIADQVIVSSGTANEWLLKTLGSNAFTTNPTYTIAASGGSSRYWNITGIWGDPGSSYIITTRSGESYYIAAGKSDGTNQAPYIIRLSNMYSKINGFGYTSGSLIISNSDYSNGTQIRQIGGTTNTLTITETTESAYNNSTKITVKDPLFGSVSDKSADITTSLTTLATIAGTDIKAKINVSDKAATIGTSATTIATIGGVDITASIGSYASSGHSHSYLVGAGNVSYQAGTSTLYYSGQISSSVSGSPATTDNSNSVLTVNRHPGDFYSQIGFGSDGRIKYRSYSDQAISSNVTKTWNTLAYTSEIPTTMAWSAITNKPDLMYRLGVTPTSSSHLNIGTSIDHQVVVGFVNGNSYYDNTGGIGLDNRSVILHFNGGATGGTGHWTQLYLNSGSLCFRSEDHTDWYSVVHSGNIGSQSVNYATSAGSAGSVAWSNITGKPDTFSPSGHDHMMLYCNTTSNLNSFTGDYYFKYARFSAGATGQFSVNSNANAVLWIYSHPGTYGHQLGFSSNGKVYDRCATAGSWSGWVEFIHSGGGQTINGNLTASSFIKSGSTSSKVLLGDGSDKNLSDFIGSLNWDSTNKKIQYKKIGDSSWNDLADLSSAFSHFRSGTASSLTSLDITKTFIYVTLSANVAASAFTLSSAMSTGQCLTVLVYNSGSATISITVPSSWKSLDGYNLTCGATKFLEISIVKYASGANDYILSSKAQ